MKLKVCGYWPSLILKISNKCIGSDRVFPISALGWRKQRFTVPFSNGEKWQSTGSLSIQKKKYLQALRSYNPAFEAVCETRMGESVNRVITILIPNIKPPTPGVDEKLNALSVNRWKLRFEQLETEFKEEKKEKFIKGINKLGNSNKKNPNLENIYFDAAKFMARFDKVEAIKFYIQYIYYDMLSDKIDKKPFSKTVLKLLFKTPDQQSNFDQLIEELEKSKDLDKVMADAEKVFQPKRRKIQLDESVISEVIREDHDTVEFKVNKLT